MKYIKYKNMVVEFQGTDFIEKYNQKSVFGKGKLVILVNWCGNVDYVLEHSDCDDNGIEYVGKHIILRGRCCNIEKTTIIQAIIFLLYQKKLCLDSVISLHASAIIRGDELSVFLGNKGAGKTSLCYFMSKKYDDVRLVANDYIEIKLLEDGSFVVVGSDCGSEIAFRSHVLYNLDKQLYRELTGTEKLIYNEIIKTNIDYVDLINETLSCKKLNLYFIGIDRTTGIEVSEKKGNALEVELYKELVSYIRGKSVAGIEDRKYISPYYLDASYFFEKSVSDSVFSMIRQLVSQESVSIKWLRGEMALIIDYLAEEMGIRGGEMIDFPKAIEFQMHNACNANCIICPYAEIEEKKYFMDDSLLGKLLDEIGEREILLIPYLNNEPFLDKAFCKKIKKINEKCPNSKIEISTNLSMCNSGMIHELEQLKIFELRISIFGMDKDTYNKMMPGLDYDKMQENLNLLIESNLRNTISKIGITMIEHEEVKIEEYKHMEQFCNENGISFNKWGFLDRAGNNTRYRNLINQGKVVGCEQNRPIERMHILANGEVILCCQDWRKTVVLGNLKENTVQEIWNGTQYQEARERIYGGKKDSFELCKKCKLSIKHVECEKDGVHC